MNGTAEYVSEVNARFTFNGVKNTDPVLAELERLIALVRAFPNTQTALRDKAAQMMTHDIADEAEKVLRAAAIPPAPVEPDPAELERQRIEREMFGEEDTDGAP